MGWKKLGLESTTEPPKVTQGYPEKSVSHAHMTATATARIPKGVPRFGQIDVLACSLPTQ